MTELISIEIREGADFFARDECGEYSERMGVTVFRSLKQNIYQEWV